MDHSIWKFHQSSTKNNNKKTKERYQRVAIDSQEIETRIFNHNRTSRKDTNITENKKIERAYCRNFKEGRSKRNKFYGTRNKWQCWQWRKSLKTQQKTWKEVSDTIFYKNDWGN